MDGKRLIRVALARSVLSILFLNIGIVHTAASYPLSSKIESCPWVDRVEPSNRIDRTSV